MRCSDFVGPVETSPLGAMKEAAEQSSNEATQSFVVIAVVAILLLSMVRFASCCCCGLVVVVVAAIDAMRENIVIQYTDECGLNDDAYYWPMLV